ncbi:hypothetical protein DNTS_018476 [Danionella cerebrum]|uniref:Uncharacterized protein n=1 Tax=Danionella cerebrum TaxID=2873325 RepID=A0A553MYW4_9TELE|nr:hypothetical protein DNTS_018476 [Danionella translucida]
MKRTSPLDVQEQNSTNMDLLSLFITNHIASKKEKNGKPKINHMIFEPKVKKDWKGPVQLPMSPCSPSKLNLVASQSQQSSVSTPGFKVRKHFLSEEFKLKLSPVLESNMSDGSGSEIHHQPSSSGSRPPFQLKPLPDLPFSGSPEHINSTNQGTPQESTWIDMFKKGKDVQQNNPVIGFRFDSKLSNPELEEYPVKKVHLFSHLGSSEDMESEVACKESTKLLSLIAIHVPRMMGHQELKKNRSATTSISAKLNRSAILEFLSWQTTHTYQRIANLQHHHKLRSAIRYKLPNVPANARHKANKPILFNLQSDAQRPDQNPIVAQDTATQTTALSYSDASVQCSLTPHSNSEPVSAVNQETSLKNLLNPVVLFTPKQSCETRARPEESAVNQSPITLPSFMSLRSQKSQKQDLRSVLRSAFLKSSVKLDLTN